MISVRVQLLGPARAHISGEAVAFKADKRYQCLSYLAFKGDWVSRDELAYLFWPDVSTSDARHSLRQLVKRIRALPWLPALDTERERIRWLTQTDTDALERLLERHDYPSLPAAYSGDLLEGLMGGESNEFTSWLEHEREHLRAAWRKALLQHARELEKEGRFDKAVTIMEVLLARDPLDEEAVRAMLRLGLRLGDRRRVLDEYQGFCQQLKFELELAPTTETQRLAGALQAAAFDPATRQDASSIAITEPEPPALPEAATSFIGRDLELAHIAHLLAKPDCRLLTLTGFGGVGKSRLALRATEELAPRYGDGAAFVYLEAFENPEALPVAIASGLGLALGGRAEPLEQLTQRIKEKHLLLVLDTFEHLVGGAPLLARLLGACPNLDVLVTSRERLGLETEWLLPLGGLSFPRAGDASLQDALTYDALQLLVLRGERVRPGYSLRETDLPHALKLCRLVDGSPLGLELAAVWLRALSLQEIVLEIEGNLDFLEGAEKSDRQRGLRAVFEHSWKLLRPREQQVLSRLSVFRGGFRKEAAAVIAGASIAVLAALVDKSLLRVSLDGRYDRHPLMYQYAREKLAGDPEPFGKLQAKHASTYLALVEEGDANPQGGEQDALLAAEGDNLRAAFTWARDEGAVRTELRLATSLARLWHRRGNIQEGFTLLAPTLARPETANFPAVHARALLAVSDLALALGKVDEARVFAEDGLSIAKRIRERRTVAAALLRLGHVARLSEGNPAAARVRYEQSSDMLREFGDSPGLALSLSALSVLAYERGDLDTAQKCAKEGLAVNRRIGRTRGVAYCLGVLGSIALDKGDHATATSNYEEELSIYRDLEDPRNVAMVLANLGNVFATQGNSSRARALQEESLALRRQLGDKGGIAFVLGNLGGLALDEGEFAKAKALHEESLAMRRELGDKLRIGESLKSLGLIAKYEGDLSAAESLQEEGLNLRRESGDKWG
ncbi:MAG TPA: tetratricopeptide repeat protein, partial [Trueperaceae bacterium]|nr:tetratricopeptide repeat protein [Trueperaceae bacterium]